MTPTQIDNLVAARAAITTAPDLTHTPRAVDHIDAVLRDVPQGQRADVDALLGRPPAMVEEWESFTRRVEAIDGYGMMGDRD